jgi:xylulokinase
LSLLGIDIGTTGVRAAAFDTDGRVLGEARAEGGYATPFPGHAEAEADEWWAQVCACCSRLAGSTSLAAIDAVCVTGQAPTVVVVDGEGRPLRPAILWLDVRAHVEATAIDESLGPGGALALCGNRMHAYYLGPKLAWLQAHEPGLLERAAMVLQSHAFVVLKMTGEATCDPSTAMLCAPLLDARAGGWSPRGAQAAGVPLRLLPRIVQSHEVVGRVTRAASALTGLREGTPVVAGGGDFAASTLGAGVVDEGQGCLMLGTAGNLLVPTREPRFDARLIGSRHVGCDRWLSLGGTLCGAALEWFRETFAPVRGVRGEGRGDEAVHRGNETVDWTTLEAEAVAAGPAGPDLLMLPYLQGERTPIWDETARGVFFGLDLTHRRGHLLRALVEGIALGFRHCMQATEEAGVVLHHVTAANGAGRSALLRQTLADALGLPLTWAAGDVPATVRGAALLAGLGSGVLRDCSTAREWDQRHARHVRHDPDPRAHERLERTFARRLALYDAVRDLGALTRNEPQTAPR